MQALNLMVHTGNATKVDRAVLGTWKTPEPQGIWRPIPHSVLVDGVQKSLERSGLQVVAEAHAVSTNGARYFGMLQVQNGKNAEDYATVIGLRNSHDKTFPAGLVVGSGVFVCDNLAFSGEIAIARKHTTNLRRDLPSLIEGAVGRLGELRQRQDDRIGQYKLTGIGDSEAHDIVIQALDARVLPVTRIPDVIREWREPKHEEFKPRNAWSLFNSFTEVLKESALFQRPRTTQALHGLLDTACHLN